MNESVILLKENQLSVTKQRVQLLDFIMNTKGAFSIQNFTDLVPDIDTVTVYRFLSILQSKKIISSIGEINGKNYYEYRKTDISHPHFVCDECHQVKCLHCLSNSEITLFKNYIKGALAKEINIIIGGVCEKCLYNH